MIRFIYTDDKNERMFSTAGFITYERILAWDANSIITLWNGSYFN